MEAKILATKVLVREYVKEEKKLASGIIIPQQAGKDPNIRGEVVLCGKGTTPLFMPVKVGDTVFFNPHSPQRVRVEDVDYLVLDVKDILLYITK